MWTATRVDIPSLATPSDRGRSSLPVNTTIGDEDGTDVADPDDEQSPTVDDYDPVSGSDTDDEADALLDSADGAD